MKHSFPLTFWKIKGSLGSDLPARLAAYEFWRVSFVAADAVGFVAFVFVVAFATAVAADVMHTLPCNTALRTLRVFGRAISI